MINKKSKTSKQKNVKTQNLLGSLDCYRNSVFLPFQNRKLQRLYHSLWRVYENRRSQRYLESPCADYPCLLESRVFNIHTSHQNFAGKLLAATTTAILSVLLCRFLFNSHSFHLRILFTSSILFKVILCTLFARPCLPSFAISLRWLCAALSLFS